jgi:hypothetical protein
MSNEKLSFGLNGEYPKNVTAVWGARLIYPNELVSDRQSMIGGKTKEGSMLLAWLNSGAYPYSEGAFTMARKNAKTLSDSRLMTPASHDIYILYEDDYGVIKGSPNMSGGYLYVCAYLKPEKSARKVVRRKTGKSKPAKKTK